ncbi:MAG: hypothetical protein EPO68_09480, partial [Planctomycetota bacterium]
QPDEKFGSSVAFDGDALIVGAPGFDFGAFTQAGRAFAFRRTPSGWIEEAALLDPTPGASGACGRSVAVEGDVAVVGAPMVATGEAHVYRRGPGGWAFEQTLLASGGKNGDEFGSSVAIDAGRILVGATRHKLSQVEVGAAYVFERVGGVWQQQAKLVPPNLTTPNTLLYASSEFGTSVALEGTRALISAQLCSFVFDETAPGQWSESTRLRDLGGLSHGDLSGKTVALDGAHALIGDPTDHDLGGTLSPGTPTGAAVVWSLDGAQCPTLRAWSRGAPTSTGATQDFGISAPAASATSWHLMLGSLSGTSPGVDLGGGILVPLVPDVYTLALLQSPQAGPLKHGFAPLDSARRGYAKIVVPGAVLASLKGVSAWHCALVLDLAVGTAVQVSAPVELRLY